MRYAFYISLLIIIILNAYFGVYKETYSWLYSEVINTVCMSILLGASALEIYQKSKKNKT